MSVFCCVVRSKVWHHLLGAIVELFVFGIAEYRGCGVVLAMLRHISIAKVSKEVAK